MEQLHKERVVSHLHDVPFVLDYQVSFVLQDELLLHQLEGIEATIEFGSNQVHMAESSRAQSLDYFEVFERYLFGSTVKKGF